MGSLPEIDNLFHGPGCRFGYADLATIGNDSRTVWWKANTGSMDELFYNPHHRQQVR